MIVGLGNPGARYGRTRHNAGFLTLDALRAPGPLWVRMQDREESTLEWGGRGLTLVRPMTFMNRSGEPVGQAARERGLSPEEILVLVDDVALPWGRIRLRSEGGAGGHKGLLSIEGALGSLAYPRLRLGVGSPPPGVDLATYVLEPVPDALMPEFLDLAERAAHAAVDVLDLGVLEAMNRWNPSPPAGSGPTTGLANRDAP